MNYKYYLFLTSIVIINKYKLIYLIQFILNIIVIDVLDSNKSDRQLPIPNSALPGRRSLRQSLLRDRKRNQIKSSHQKDRSYLIGQRQVPLKRHLLLNLSPEKIRPPQHRHIQ